MPSSSELAIPTVIAEDAEADFSGRQSLDSLSSLRNDHDDTSLSLNDDLASMGTGGFSSRVSRRSFDSTSVFTSSFRPSFDDSFPSLGMNKLSIQRVSPLGPNSIYELIADVDARKQPSSLSPTLNRASRGKLSIPPPTQKDIPQIQLSKLGKVPKEEFKEYLAEVGNEYEKYNANKRLTTNSLHTLAKRQNTTGDLLDEEDGALETIPDVYFNEDFNLDDPRIFKMVTEGHDIENLNEQLQEKLSWYLDTIEVHLVNEISKSSSSFFDALNDLNDINDKNVKILDMITKLRQKLQLLREKKIQHNLKKLELEKKRENTAKLEQGLVQVTTVMQQSDVAEQYFFNGEYEKCLQTVDYVEDLLKGEAPDLNWPYPLQDLREVPAMSNLRELLCNLRSQTGESYSSLFTDYLMTDLRSHYEDIDHAKTMDRIMSGSSYKVVIEDSFKEKLTEYIIGLTRCEEVATAFKNYEENVVNDMKNIVRVFLPNEQPIDPNKSNASTSSATGGKGTSLSTLIKGLTPREFEIMLIKIYTTVSEGLRRLSVHQKLLLDLALNNMSGKEEEQASLIMQLDIRPCINKSIEIIQIRMGKIITVRKDLNANLRHDFFLRLFYINSVFLNECESISATNYKFLPDVLNSQVKGFNSMFQQGNLRRISHSLEIEQWQPVIVPLSSQQDVNMMLENHNLDKEQAWKTSLSHMDTDISEPPAPKEEEKSHKKSIVVGDKTFVASSSLLGIINIIKDLLILKSNFPQYSNVYESHIIEVVEYYKNRVTQATKATDGGQNNNKINLSIVSESLDCIQEVLDCVREAQSWGH